MGMIDRAKRYFSEKQEANKQRSDRQREFEDEQDFLERHEYKKNALAELDRKEKEQAARDMRSKRGIAKIRAINKYYQSPRPKPKWLKELSEFTKANKARTANNMERAKAIKKAVLEDKADKQRVLRDKSRMRSMTSQAKSIILRSRQNNLKSSKPRGY